MTGINKEKLIQTIMGNSDLNYKASEYWAEQIINKGHDILKKNVNEWMENQPLSDIDIHGISINDVLEYWSTPFFPMAILDMSKLYEEGEDYLPAIFLRWSKR